MGINCSLIILFMFLPHPEFWQHAKIRDFLFPAALTNNKPYSNYLFRLHILFCILYFLQIKLYFQYQMKIQTVDYQVPLLVI